MSRRTVNDFVDNLLTKSIPKSKSNYENYKVTNNRTTKG